MTEFPAPFVDAAVVAEFPYLLSFGGTVGELTESVSSDGESVLGFDGGHGCGHGLEPG